MDGIESSDQIFADVPHEDHIELAKPLSLEGKGAPLPPTILSGPPTVLGGSSQEILGGRDKSGVLRQSSSKAISEGTSGRLSFPVERRWGRVF